MKKNTISNFYIFMSGLSLGLMVLTQWPIIFNGNIKNVLICGFMSISFGLSAIYSTIKQ